VGEAGAASGPLRLHGTLVEVLGVGALLRGPSGVGKSETALELIRRGHRLVADDVVELRVQAGALIGEAPPLIRHHVEIRGLGILYVPELFGPEAVRDACAVGLVCRLEHWREGAEYERVGFARPCQELLGVSLPSLLLPVRPAGNMATLVEVAVRDHRQRASGVVAAERLDERVLEESRRT
jgi:HPr kinase/phosphorylase